MGCCISKEYQQQIAAWEQTCRANHIVRVQNDYQRHQAHVQGRPWALPIGRDPVDPPRPRKESCL